MTNRDIINGLTNEQLAQYIVERFVWICSACELKPVCDGGTKNITRCKQAIIDWFNLPASEDE